MKILFFHSLNYYWLKKLPVLEKEFPTVQFVKKINPDERLSYLKDADAIVCGRLTVEQIDNSPNLKAIFIPFTGVDSFPIEYIQNKQILVSNTHANAGYVAEKAVSLTLALLGRIVEFHNDLRNGIWNLQLNPPFYWTTIQGKTCAVLGYGKIGQSIAKFLKPYNCRIIAYKKHINSIVPYADEITDNLQNAIEKSEIIFVSLPLTELTKKIINKDVLADMEGKYLINIGRGDLIEEEGLYLALKNRILKGAAIDVWYNYPSRSKPEPVFPSKYPIHELKNVVISPHKSGFTKQSIEGMIDDTIENIRSFLKTGVPSNIVRDNY